MNFQFSVANGMDTYNVVYPVAIYDAGNMVTAEGFLCRRLAPRPERM